MKIMETTMLITDPDKSIHAPHSQDMGDLEAKRLKSGTLEF